MFKSVVSDNYYLKQGLYALLGGDFIDKFYIIVDFDHVSSAKQIILENPAKEIIGFASSDIAAYRAQASGVKYVIDKTSDLKDILDLFLFARTAALYVAKRELTLREKELLGLVCCGVKFSDLANLLGVTDKTVYTFIRNIRVKLGCENRIIFHKLCIS